MLIPGWTNILRSHLAFSQLGRALAFFGVTSVLVTPTSVAGDGGQTDRVSYVALGDSIAEGVAAENSYGYVNRFRDALTEIRGEVDLVNVAHGGFATSELLAQLADDEELQSALRSADLITLSIGGNHLLACGKNNFATVDTDCVNAGVALFQRDWPNVLERLRGNSIRAMGRLLVMNLFNPYTGDAPNFAVVERPVQLINDTIQDAGYRSIYHYDVVDVHDAFSGRGTTEAWNVCTWLGFCGDVRDPHPSDAGHAEIARLHMREYLARS
jgi:lysophospholipase L1-like esterase